MSINLKRLLKANFNCVNISSHLKQQSKKELTMGIYLVYKKICRKTATTPYTYFSTIPICHSRISATSTFIKTPQAMAFIFKGTKKNQIATASYRISVMPLHL